MFGRSAYTQNQKDQLVQRHYPLVKRIAHHLIKRLPSEVMLDDLLQSGLLGLLEAAANFDISKGASFETFAGIRIRGAMLDEVRRNNWVPRSVHRNSRMITDAIHQIEQKVERDATDSEVAEVLNITVEEYRQMLQDAHSGQMLDFDELGALAEQISNSFEEKTDNPYEGLQRQGLRDSLAKALASLPERECLILSLYYVDELNLKEIGEVLDVSESRISQINSQAMLRLQARMREWRN